MRARKMCLLTYLTALCTCVHTQPHGGKHIGTGTVLIAQDARAHTRKGPPWSPSPLSTNALAQPIHPIRRFVYADNKRCQFVMIYVPTNGSFMHFSHKSPRANYRLIPLPPYCVAECFPPFFLSFATLTGKSTEKESDFLSADLSHITATDIDMVYGLFSLSFTTEDEDARFTKRGMALCTYTHTFSSLYLILVSKG